MENSRTSSNGRLTSKIPAAVRLALGGIFTIFGLNGFFGFLPMPAPQGSAATFMGGLYASGYFFPLLAGTQTLVGLMLLAKKFVPLALLFLAPITINIVAFHLFVEPKGILLAPVVLALHLSVAWHYRWAYRSVLASEQALPVPNEVSVRRATAQTA